MAQLRPSRLMGGLTSIARVLATADFRAPLRTSLVPTRGTGAPTFTRATTGTVVDHEGVLRTCLAGEARFTSARRVRNLLTYTEDFSNAAWTKRDTTYSGGRLIETATTSDHSILQAVTAAVGDVIAVSCYAKADQNSFLQILLSTGQVTGNPKANFDVSTGVLGTVDSGVAASITSAPDVGVGYYRCTAVVTMAAASCTPFFGMVQAANSARLQSYAGNASNGLYLTKIQVENITGRTDQTTPSEYVSVGVLSAPYHGTGVDGVKCFDTTLAGVPIPTATLKGYLAEVARTNLCLQSNAFTTAPWVNSGTVLTQDVIGPGGVANSAWTITDNSAVATEGFEQPVTLTAATYTYSVFVRKTTGAQASYPVIRMASSPLTSICTIDTSNGVATAWTSLAGGWTIQPTVTRCTSFNTNFWLVELAFTATAASWSILLIPAGVISPIQATAFDVSAQGSAVFYGAQVELGPFATSYIQTTTVAATRNADVLTYPSAGNILGTVGSAYVEYTPNAAPATLGAAQILSVNLSAGSTPLYQHASGSIRSYDGTTIVSSGVTPTINITSKIASAWGTSQNITVGGAAPGTGAFDGNFSVDANIGIGNYTNGSAACFGNIANVCIWTRKLPDAILQRITK